MSWAMGGTRRVTAYGGGTVVWCGQCFKNFFFNVSIFSAASSITSARGILRHWLATSHTRCSQVGGDEDGA